VGGLNLEGQVFVRASQRGLLGLFGDLLRLTVSILVESSPEREREREREREIRGFQRWLQSDLQW
jgi:hypothetical protein